MYPRKSEKTPSYAFGSMKWCLYRPIGRYRRSKLKNSLSSVNVICHLLDIYTRLRTAHCLRQRNWGLSLILVELVGLIGIVWGLGIGLRFMDLVSVSVMVRDSCCSGVSVISSFMWGVWSGASERFRKWGYKFVRTFYNLVVKIVCYFFDISRIYDLGVQGVQVLNLGFP